MTGLHLRGPLGIWQAFRWSLSGLKAAFLRDESFRLYSVAAVFLLPLALWLGGSGIERALLSGVVLLVLVVELLNSAIEAVFERYGNETHPVTGMSKDIGSAAVFMSIMLAIVVWVVVLAGRSA